jgi:uncharacterized protein (TIGR04255 family)
VAKLKLPDARPVQYSKNFVSMAVCELRFPTLLELDAAPPVKLQKALRKDYPLYEKSRAVSVGPTGFEGENRHIFRSRQNGAVVAFRASAVSLETDRYTTFEAFYERLSKVVAAVQEVIDSDFFTRVGLRYINQVPIDDNSIDGWLNRDLVVPLANRTYGTVARFWQEVQGAAEVGAYIFRHGFAEEQKIDHPKYVVDIDMYDEETAVSDVLTRTRELHSQSYKFFMWAAGPKTLQAMGSAREKAVDR